MSVSAPLVQSLRYGENPHQKGALYGNWGMYYKQLQGKELSYNNILDFEAAVDILREFRETTACVVKHNNPSGVASDSSLKTAVTQAIECDPLSAFGGIVGLNENCDEHTAATIFENLQS